MIVVHPHYVGNIHPKEKRNFEKGCVEKQLRRLARREERKKAKLAKEVTTK